MGKCQQKYFFKAPQFLAECKREHSSGGDKEKSMSFLTAFKECKQGFYALNHFKALYGASNGLYCDAKNNLKNIRRLNENKWKNPESERIRKKSMRQEKNEGDIKNKKRNKA